MTNLINQQYAIHLCNKLYPVLSEQGFYPALTGGCLYKQGSRKDIDILIFRHRQNVESFEMKDLEETLIKFGFTDLQYFGFVTKSKYEGFVVDLFNPESEDGDDYNDIIKEVHIDESFNPKEELSCKLS